jgi:nitrate/nitrite transporter NarK
VGPLITGLLLDRAFHGNPRPTLLAGFALMSACVYALRFPGVTENAAVLEGVLILAGFGAQFALPTIYYFIARSYEPAMVGKMTGLWTGLGAFGGVVGVYIAGVTVAAQGTYTTTFTIQAAVAMAAFLLTFALVAAAKKRAAGS